MTTPSSIGIRRPSATSSPGRTSPAQAQAGLVRDHQILATTLQGMVGLRSLYTDEVVDSHQIMMMNDYMPTKVNGLYKALLSLG